MRSFFVVERDDEAGDELLMQLEREVKVPISRLMTDRESVDRCSILEKMSHIQPV